MTIHNAPRRPENAGSAQAPEPLTDHAPVPVAQRHDGWTPAKQRAFIEVLADTGIGRTDTPSPSWHTSGECPS